MLCSCTFPRFEAVRFTPIFYGPAASQFGELRLPLAVPDSDSLSRYPVVVLIHGGCWRFEYSLDYLRPLATKLARWGFATWLMEYRRLGEPGGGWSGTLRDVSSGMEQLRVLSEAYPLDLQRLIVLGHSAGGQLALWLAGRSALGKDSDLFIDGPLQPSAVIGLAPITDVADYARGNGRCNASAAEFLGGLRILHPERFRDIRPRVPAQTPVYLIHGEDDDLVPNAPSRCYINERMQTGQQGWFQVAAKMDHFDLIDPDGPGWKILTELLQPWISNAAQGQ